jgi:glucose/arabinose dehydrogenase
MTARRLAVAVIGAALAVAALGAAGAFAKTGVKLKRIGRFHQPTYVTTAPSVPGVLVVEKAGRIKLVQGRHRRVFLNVAGLVSSGGERGLLSVAFPPDYATSRLLYVYFTNRGGDIVIAELHADPDGTHADAGTLRVVLTVPHPGQSNHNGGQLQFGPDGFLYAGTGDGGGAGDRPDNAQSLNSLLGKLLRIDPRAQGGAPYSTPPGNPFAGGGGRNEIYSYGLRNPFRFSFDLVTDPAQPRIAIADVGQDRFEELDYLSVAAAAGANFGWNDFEGFAPFEGAHPPTPGNATAPIKVYGLGGKACAMIGGYVVRDPALRSIFHRYVYGDFCSGAVRSLVPDPGGAKRDRPTGVRVRSLSSFGESSTGALYAASLDGPVYRFVPKRRPGR